MESALARKVGTGPVVVTKLASTLKPWDKVVMDDGTVKTVYIVEHEETTRPKGCTVPRSVIIHWTKKGCSVVPRDFPCEVKETD